jgi:GAF domain-containing protein
MSLLLATKQPRVIEDAAQDMRVILPARLAAEKYGFHGLAAVPLLANDRSIGVLVVMDGKTRLFTDDEVSLLTAFADQASLALERARLLNEAERERERSDALYQVSNKLASVHETDEVLDLIVNETPSGHVMATKKPIDVEDMTGKGILTSAQRLLAQEHGFHGATAVPLLANDKSIGVLVVNDKRVRRFTDDEVSLLTAFADQASLALEKARLLAEAEKEKERERRRRKNERQSRCPAYPYSLPRRRSGRSPALPYPQSSARASTILQQGQTMGHTTPESWRPRWYSTREKVKVVSGRVAEGLRRLHERHIV